MFKILKFSALSLLIVFTNLFAINSLMLGQVSAETCKPTSDILGLPTWYKYLDGETDETGRCNPVLDSGESGREFNVALPIGLAVLEIFIRLAGLVAVVMVIIGAFKFITSQGNPDNAASARKTIVNALIGLAIVILATAIVNFIGNELIRL